jgi:hypothetical protein
MTFPKNLHNRIDQSAFKIITEKYSGLLALSTFSGWHSFGAALLLFTVIVLSTVMAGAAGQPMINCIICHQKLSGRLAVPVKLWNSSIHAEHGITCDACHGGDPVDSADAMSPIRGFRGKPAATAIPALCGGCHMGVLKHNNESAHGRALGKGGPSCVTCHGSHGVVAATVDQINRKNCSPCHTFEKARLIRSAMLKRDRMLTAIEKRIKVLQSQGVDTDSMEKRLFALRNRFHTMFHSLDIKMIIQESDHIQVELEKTNGAGGVGAGPVVGILAVAWALVMALLFYMIKKKVE